MTDLKPVTFRIILIGNAQVGKTSIVQRLVNREFFDHYEETVGAAFFTYTHTIEGQPILLQIWDTAGQEKYQSLGPIYYRNSSAAIAIYDQSDPDSFKILPDWILAFKESANVASQIFVVGNKNDLQEVVPQQQAEDFAEENGYKFFSVSAKTGQNIDRLFQTVAQELHSIESTALVQATSINSSKNIDSKRSGCC